MTFTKTAKLVISTLMFTLATPTFASSIEIPTTPEVTAPQTAVPVVPEPVMIPAVATIPEPIGIAPDAASVECLVKVMNHEAGGERVLGQKAVAYVVLNRMKSPRFPNSVCGVVYQRAQFTNIRNAKAIPTNKYNQLKTLALSVLTSYSHITDPTAGSTYYHNRTVWPKWRNVIRTLSIGNHIFFRQKR